MAPFHYLIRENKQHSRAICVWRERDVKIFFTFRASCHRLSGFGSCGFCFSSFRFVLVEHLIFVYTRPAFGFPKPLDIRNWFPSYIYESPELNTLDGLQDFDGSGETCLREGKTGKSGENQPIGKFNGGLLSAERKSSDKCNKSDEFEYSKSAALVTGSSESLSFSSEPPYIKNWFSSYLYESSPLDTAHDFTISDYKVREDGKVCNAQKSFKQDTKDVMDFIDAEESIELPTQSRTSNVVVKCTNLAKDTNVDYQPVDKDVHNVVLTPMSSMMSQLTSEKVSKQILRGQRTENNNLGSVEKLGDTNAYGGKDYDVKLDCSLFERTIHKLSNMENNIGSRDGKYGHKSIGRKDSLEKEGLHEIASPGTLDLTVPEEDSGRSIRKENKETELLENGFISTRKSSKENAGNLTRPVQVQCEYGIKPALRCRRKVLSETSNFLSHGVLESTGKWCCPQKNKPNLGPPLKQLRLEQWVRRV